VAPQAGADLVFPEIAQQKTNVSDFAPGTDFNSITFTGGGYTLGGSNHIRLGAGGLTFDAPTASAIDTVNILVELPGLRNFNVVQSTLYDALRVNGEVVGDGGINKIGAGFLGLGGINSFDGLAEVSQGTLIVHSNTALGRTGAGGGTEVQSGATLEL